MAPFTLVLLVGLLAASASANFLSDALPQPGTTPQEQIQCYALPYGGFGFATHVLTYYTFLMLTFGRSPWRWTRLKHYKADIVLALIGLPLTVGPVVLTMIRCRSRWIFYLLAAWKLSLSLMLTATTITTALCVRRGVNVGEYNRGRYRTVMQAYGQDEPTKYQGSIGRTLLSLGLYGIGTIVGFVGLMTLVSEAWNTTPLLRHLSYGAAGLFGFLAVLGFLFGAFVWPESWIGSGTAAACFAGTVIFGAGAVIYSDWALAAIAHNMVGWPDGNNWRVSMFYWTYFAAKRLPMLSC